MGLTIQKIKTAQIGKRMHDRRGLYLTLSSPGRGKWTIRYMLRRRSPRLEQNPEGNKTLSGKGSTKLNKRQQIAAGMLGLGQRPTEVAKQLSVSNETISRWQSREDFAFEVDQVTKALLHELLDERVALVDACHGVIGNILADNNVHASVRGNAALKYLNFVGLHTSAYDFLSRRLGHIGYKYRQNNEDNDGDKTSADNLKLLGLFR